MSAAILINFDQPWFLLLAIPALAVILFPFLLLPSARRKSVKKIVPLILHMVVVIILVFIIAGIEIIDRTDEQAVVLLIDTSYSTETVKNEIEKNAEEIFNLIDSNSPVGVVAFGENVIYDVEIESDLREFSLTSAGDKETNIAGALEYAASLCPADKALRIIILSDGKQTMGDADGKAYNIAGQGVRIDAMYYDTTNISTAEMQLSSFTCPPGCYKNVKTVLKAEIKSNISGNVDAVLYDGDIMLEKKNVSVSAGSNVVEFSVIPENAGLHKYSLKIEPENDTVLHNNQMIKPLMVDGKSSTLIVTEDPESVSRLASLLSNESDVEVIRAYDTPDTVVELCKYDQIVLSNVQYDSFNRNFFTSIEKYVSVYGRSLFVAGGRDTFMYGGMSDTQFEDMLPISFEFDEKDSEADVALMLVLDCSRSMGGSNNYISIAKQGAIKCLEALTTDDYAGVISFSTEATLESPIVKLTQTNKETLTRVISGIDISAGTYYEPALIKAYEELSKAEADIKHIIFLSDGQSTDGGYYDIATKASEEGITVSTIGLTFSSSSLEYLAMCGKGRYYYVDSASDLPDIMLNEAEQARVDPLIDGDFKPTVDDANDFTDLFDFSSLPPLGGHLGTTLKDDGVAHLITETGHPIYTTWEYGEGVVACFTSDLCGKWSGGWFDDPVGQDAIRCMLKSNLADYHSDSSLIFSSETDGNTARVTVMTSGEKDTNSVSITVKSEYGEESYDLAFVYKGYYSGNISLSGVGLYEITVTEKNQVETVDDLTTYISVPYSKEYDAFVDGGKSFLEGLCGYSNGKVFTDINELVSVKMSEIEIVYNPIVPLALIAAILFIADVAVRKLRFKDIKKYFAIFDRNKA